MPGFSPSQLDDYRRYVLNSQTIETNSAIAPGVVVGAVQFDPSTSEATLGGLTRAIYFEAVLCATPGMTATLELYNATDAVVEASIVIAATIPALRKVILLVPGTIPNASKLYLARLYISAGVPGPADRAICYHCSINNTLRFWTPEDLGTKFYWLADPNNVLLTGAHVNVWYDISGNNHHANGDAVNTPHWVASHAALNNRPAINVTSNKYFPSVDGTEANADWTVIMILDYNSQGANPNWGLAGWGAGAFTQLISCPQTNMPAHNVGYLIAGGWVDLFAPIAGAQSLVWRYNNVANTGEVFRNNVMLGSGTYPVQGTPLCGGVNTSLFPGGSGVDFYVSEVFGYNRALSNSELTQIDDYIYRVYGF